MHRGFMIALVTLETDIAEPRSFESTGEYADGRLDVVPRRPAASR